MAANANPASHVPRTDPIEPHTNTDVRIDVREPSELSAHSRPIAEHPAGTALRSYAMGELYEWGLRAPSHSPASPASPLHHSVGSPSLPPTGGGVFATTPLPFSTPNSRPAYYGPYTPATTLPADATTSPPEFLSTNAQTHRDLPTNAGHSAAPTPFYPSQSALGISVPFQYTGGSKKDVPVFRPSEQYISQLLASHPDTDSYATDSDPIQWDFPHLEPGIDKDAQIWKSYLDEASQQDKDNVMSWNQNMDVILVFVSSMNAIYYDTDILFAGGLVFSYPDCIHY